MHDCVGGKGHHEHPGQDKRIEQRESQISRGRDAASGQLKPLIEQDRHNDAQNEGEADKFRVIILRCHATDLRAAALGAHSVCVFSSARLRRLASSV